MRLAPPQPSHIAPHGRTAISNYSADVGAGSNIITLMLESPGWRALLGTVAAGSLWLYSARSARAACTADGPTILNCTDTIAGTAAPGVSFKGAPGGVGPFRIAIATDETIGNVGAGVDVIGAGGASFRLYYEGRFGDLVEQHGGASRAPSPSSGARARLFPGFIRGLARSRPGAKTRRGEQIPTRRPACRGSQGRAKNEDILVKTWSALLLVAAFIGLAPLPAASAGDPVVARVNGVDIKQSDLDFAASEVGPKIASLPTMDRQRVLLQYVIENELMAGAGQKDNLDKMESFPGRVAYHQRRALRDAFFDVKITDAVTEADAKKIFDEKITEVKPEQEIRARHILVETENEAKEIAERLKKGEDFAALAKEKSKDSAEGGDLGFFTKGQMLKPFEDAAFALEVEEISEPVQTQFGWHIIVVEEKRDQPLPTFDQVKEALMSQLVQAKAQEVVSGLRDAAMIEVVDPELKKSMEPAQGLPGDLPDDLPGEADGKN